MLIARDVTGKRCVATPELRGAGACCPACGEELVVRVPAVRVPHFAHPPGKRCAEQVASRRAQAREEKERLRSAARTRELAAIGQSALFELDLEVEGPRELEAVEGSGVSQT